MDYDNPQFIAAVKKVFLNALKQQESTNEHCQTNAEQSNGPRRVINAELTTPEPITVHTKSQDEKSNWQKVKTAAEIIGIAAAIFYAYTAVRQWREMISARNQTSAIFEESKRQFKDTLEQMRGQTEAQQDTADAAVRAYKVQSSPWVTPAEVRLIERDQFWRFIRIKTVTFNDGSTPALNVKIMHADVVFDKKYIDESDFKKYEHFTEEAWKWHAGSVGIIPPHRSWETPDDYTLPLSTVQAERMRRGGYWFFVIVIVRYEDIFHDTWYTTVCERLDRNAFAVCNVHNFIKEIPPNAKNSNQK